MLRGYQNIMLGEQKPSVHFGKLAGTEKAVLVIICIVIIAFGVYPKPLNEIAEQGTKTILEMMK